jgi:hypothetical protein
MDGLQDIDPDAEDGQEIGLVLGRSTSCVRSSSQLFVREHRHRFCGAFY